MKKHVFYSELAYVVGLVILALGTAMLVYGGFGTSIVVAPAYILHLKLSQTWSFFSFGMAEYVIQAVILATLLIVFRSRKWTWLLSFVTTVLYGLILDGGSLLTNLLPRSVPLQIVLYITGIFMCTMGIALLFSTYFTPAAYELLVKVLSRHFGWKLHIVKTVYDCISCLVAVGLSFLLFGRLEGIGIGSVVCALCYGVLIRLNTKILERIWVFEDRFPLRRHFEESEET